MDKEQNSPTSQPDKNKGQPLPGTSKDPTGRVISDKSSPGKDRQNQQSDRSGSNYRDAYSDQQKGA